MINENFKNLDLKQCVAASPDISRAKELLNWEPQVDLKAGVASVVDWYMENRNFGKKIDL